MPQNFLPHFGTTITCKGAEPLHGKGLMGIKSDKFYGRYTLGALFTSCCQSLPIGN